MATCVNCGKKGFLLKLKDGLCRECYVEMIKAQNKDDSFKSFLEENVEMIKTIEYEIEKNRKMLESPISDEEKSRLLKTNTELFEELENFCLSKGEDGKAFWHSFCKRMTQRDDTKK